MGDGKRVIKNKRLRLEINGYLRIRVHVLGGIEAEDATKLVD